MFRKDAHNTPLLLGEIMAFNDRSERPIAASAPATTQWLTNHASHTLDIALLCLLIS
jgi:hypothetical protein